MKRKAFTLIELLAVIVILAIIALIATPIILGVIENAKKGAFKDAAYGIIDAAELYYAKNIENGIDNNLSFNIIDGKVETLTYKGSIDGSGKVILTTDGKTILCVNSSNNKYNASKSIASSEVKVKDGTCSIDVNNMILYSSGGTASSDYYTKDEVDAKFDEIKNQNTMSTEEHWTGKYYVDGKKIYEKTISNLTIPVATSGFEVKTHAHNIVNIDKIINIEGIIYDKNNVSGSVRLTLPYTDPNGTTSLYVSGTNIGIMTSANSNIGNYYLLETTIQYTKTTE